MNEIYVENDVSYLLRCGLATALLNYCVLVFGEEFACTTIRNVKMPAGEPSEWTGPQRTWYRYSKNIGFPMEVNE